MLYRCPLMTWMPENPRKQSNLRTIQPQPFSPYTHTRMPAERIIPCLNAANGQAAAGSASGMGRRVMLIRSRELVRGDLFASQRGYRQPGTSLGLEPDHCPSGTVRIPAIACAPDQIAARAGGCHSHRLHPPLRRIHHSPSQETFCLSCPSAIGGSAPPSVSFVSQCWQ